MEKKDPFLKKKVSGELKEFFDHHREDIKKYRNEFPIINDKLIYLDNASTTQKPNSVIDSISNFYKNTNANVHRGTYHIADKATLQYENSRKIISQFIKIKFYKAKKILEKQIPSHLFCQVIHHDQV